MPVSLALQPLRPLDSLSVQGKGVLVTNEEEEAGSMRLAVVVGGREAREGEEGEKEGGEGRRLVKGTRVGKRRRCISRGWRKGEESKRKGKWDARDSQAKHRRIASSLPQRDPVRAR